MTVSYMPHGMRVVRLDKYCELSGETRQAVYARRRKVEWIDGKESLLAPNNNLWIDLEQVEAWVRQQKKQPVVRRPRSQPV